MQKLFASLVTTNRLKLKQAGLFHNFSSKQSKAPPKLLKHQTSLFGGATIDPKALPDSVEEFEDSLTTTVSYLKQEGLKGIWVSFENNKSYLVHVAAKHGFRYHHAKEEYVCMSLWLLENQHNSMPHFASHYVNIKGIILNENEKEVWLLRDEDGFWKFPSGRIEKEEFMVDFLEGEMLKVLGIKAKFQCIVGFKERHNELWEQPSLNFFAVCKETSINRESESDQSIDHKGNWLKINECLNSEFKVDAETKQFLLYILELRNKNAAIELEKARQEGRVVDIVSFDGKQYCKNIDLLKPSQIIDNEETKDMGKLYTLKFVEKADKY